MFGKNKKKKFSPALQKLLCNPTTPRQSTNLESGKISYGFCQQDNADKVIPIEEAEKKLNKARNNCAKLVEE